MEAHGPHHRLRWLLLVRVLASSPSHTSHTRTRQRHGTRGTVEDEPRAWKPRPPRQRDHGRPVSPSFVVTGGHGLADQPHRACVSIVFSIMPKRPRSRLHPPLRSSERPLFPIRTASNHARAGNGLLPSSGPSSDRFPILRLLLLGTVDAPQH